LLEHRRTGPYRSEYDNYGTCVSAFDLHDPYESDYALLKPSDGMRLLEPGCGPGAAATEEHPIH
jgi:hypothetical protein